MDTEGYRLQLRAHLIEFRDIPSRSYKILCLYFNSSHLAILSVLPDVRYEFFLLLFEFGSLAVEFALCLFEGSLVFAEALGGGHAAAEGPFYYLSFC